MSSSVLPETRSPQQLALIKRGREILAELKSIDERISGLGFTPKPFREERLARFQADRDKLVAEYQQAKKDFHAL